MMAIHEQVGSALYSALVSERPPPAANITRDQLVAFLDNYPPEYRDKITKLLTALLIKKRIMQQRKVLQQAAAEQLGGKQAGSRQAARTFVPLAGGISETGLTALAAPSGLDTTLPSEDKPQDVEDKYDFAVFNRLPFTENVQIDYSKMAPPRPSSSNSDCSDSSSSSASVTLNNVSRRCFNASLASSRHSGPSCSSGGRTHRSGVTACSSSGGCCSNAAWRAPSRGSSYVSSGRLHRRTWGNPLTRIFVQAADTSAAAGDAPQPDTQGAAAMTPLSTQDNNGKSSSSSGGGVSVADGTSSSCMTASSNPFARSAAQSQSWTATSSSVSDLPRPVLAPSKLGGFGCSPTVGSGLLARPKLGGPGILAPSKLFGGAATHAPKVVTDAAQSDVKFKLKPSKLGPAVNNPFFKAPTVDFELVQKNAEIKSSEKHDRKSPVGLQTHSHDDKQSINEGVSSPNSKGNPFASSNDASTRVVEETTSAVATPPPSPPHTSSSRQQPAEDGHNEAASGTEAASSHSKTEPKVALSGSVFGSFGQTREKSPSAGYSPVSFSRCSNNGVKSPVASGNPSASTNFIFGQNLQSRVVGNATEETATGEVATVAVASTPALAAAENCFTAAASTLAFKFSTSSSHTLNGGGPSKSLETSSRELAEKESREKRKFEEVEVITGEETESNVLQMICKVYSWLNGSWQERGRGILRLNDWGSGGVEMHSRLVVRTQGTLTIMLNTKIWGEMAVERANSKSVRFTALDSDGLPKIYLVVGRPKDIETLYTSLEWRVSNSRHREENCKKARTEDDQASST